MYGQSLETLIRNHDHPRDNRTFDELNDAPHWWQMPDGSPISPRFGWWELPAGGPIEPLAQVIIEAIRELALPAIQGELARPLDAKWASGPS